MKSYEALCIFNPEVKEDRIDSIIKKIEGKIVSSKGEIESVKKWGLRKLAYTIKKIGKIKEGFYVFFKFKGEGNVPQELGKTLKVIEDIIRYMVTVSIPEGEAAVAEGKAGKVEIAPSMLIGEQKEA